MKYKVNDRVRIKSLDWYNKNKDEDGNIRYKHGTAYHIFFTKYMSRFCGETLTVKCVHKESYYMNETGSCEFWTDEMIEGLVEEETKVGTALNPIELKSNANCIKQERVDELATEMDKEQPSENQNVWELPEGYIFKDERGNVINATKIVLEKVNTLKTQTDNMETETQRGYYTTEEETTNESKKVAWFTFEDNDFADKVELSLSNRELIQEDGKWFVVKKKKEYPKTYEACARILGFKPYHLICNKQKDAGDYVNNLSVKLEYYRKLIVCRDAYWKIAGEEMGLGKPWKPDWKNGDQKKYCIYNDTGDISKGSWFFCNAILAFPTKEMRDAFYENFKSEIEFCKELL